MSGPERQVFVYEVDAGDGKQHLVSSVDPRWLFAEDVGLAPEAVLGALHPGADGSYALRPDNFQQNTTFVQFLHRLVADNIGTVAAARREAQRRGRGNLFVLDHRTPYPDGQVPPEDIIGALPIQRGVLLPGEYYQPNPDHRLLTSNGFFLLAPELEAILQRQTYDRCAQVR